MSSYLSNIRRRALLSFVFVIVCCSITLQSSNTDFERDVLDEHNKYRSNHGADPLRLDEKLSENATLTAEKAAKEGNFKAISPGQSVFVSCATFKREVTGKEVTDAWYGEVCAPDFDFENPDNDKTRGFTQLVWKDTNKLGVGKATGTNGNDEKCTYIVGVYRPPGNLIGFFNENVDEGKFDKDEYCKDDNNSNDSNSAADKIEADKKHMSKTQKKRKLKSSAKTYKINNKGFVKNNEIEEEDEERY